MSAQQIETWKVKHSCGHDTYHPVGTDTLRLSAMLKQPCAECLLLGNLQDVPHGWALVLIDNERHYFVGKTSLCGLFIPALNESDFEERNDGRIPDCWFCQEALERYGDGECIGR